MHIIAHHVFHKPFFFFMLVELNQAFSPSKQPHEPLTWLQTILFEVIFFSRQKPLYLSYYIVSIKVNVFLIYFIYILFFTAAAAKYPCRQV